MKARTKGTIGAVVGGVAGAVAGQIGGAMVGLLAASSAPAPVEKQAATLETGVLVGGLLGALGLGLVGWQIGKRL